MDVVLACGRAAKMVIWADVEMKVEVVAGSWPGNIAGDGGGAGKVREEGRGFLGLGNAEGIRPSKIEAREDENRGVNLPPLLAAHLGRNKSGQPLRSSLTSVHGGHQPSTNMGGNLSPNGTLILHHT
ncbi:hypothetical protein Tco_0705909 [Tanacetum coccineum]|uniref:Uncharacterized protein n=1 Tax=Tanacetum coccineum TaxID=301880 RepID=A0ABQ4Y7Y5_9ASTR